MKLRRARRAVLLSVPLAALIATAHCYAPTEVTVVLSTDLACTETPRTAIFKGEPFDVASEAETANCTPPTNAGDSQIGSLVFIPSGSLDGRAAVKAVLARRGKSPAECDLDPTDCIFATRSFSYVAHTSRRVPIRMLEECLGQRCPDGFTCVGKDQCGSDKDTCEGDPRGPECGETVPPIGPPPRDDGGLVDARLDDVLPPVGCFPGGVLHSFMGMMPTLTAASNDSILWVAPSLDTPGATAVWRIAKNGGLAILLEEFGGIVAHEVTALGFDGEVALFAHGGGDATQYSVTAAGATKSEYPLDSRIPIAVTGVNGQMFVATAFTVATVKPFMEIPPPPSGARSFAFAPPTLFAGGTDAVYSANMADTTYVLPQFQKIVGSPHNARITTNASGQAFAVSMADVTQLGPVVRVDGNSATTLGGVTVLPNTLAVDNTHIYGATKREIVRWAIAPPTPKQLVKSVTVGTIDHVSVSESCLYYWHAGEPGAVGTVTLNVLAKTNISLDASADGK